MNSRFKSTLFILIIALLIVGCKPLPKILIIGDSISIGYTPYVKEALQGKAAVFHNPGNAQHSGTGVTKIQEWLGEENWDIIQFNWGLWDLCYRHPDSKVQGNRDKAIGTLTYSLGDYSANLDSIVTFLKTNTDATLIFVTTSYVPENEAGRFQKDALHYNAAARTIMEKHTVVINDIYPDSKRIHQYHGKGTDDVHYLEKGYQELGVLVAEFLGKYL